MDIVDLAIHVEQALDVAAQRELEEQLRSVEGVIAPRFNEPHSHLLLIAYDPAKVESRRLLHTVTAAGYRASLVGL